MKKKIIIAFSVLIILDIFLFCLACKKEYERAIKKNEETIIQKEFEEPKNATPEAKREEKILQEKTLKQEKKPEPKQKAASKNKPEQEKIAQNKKDSGSNKTQSQWSPYMKNLEKKIKKEWTPIRQKESKRTVLLFKVLKNGRVDDIKIEKTSGNKELDKAAIRAVKKAAPFDPLPVFFKGKYIEIEFTFDYNVLYGAGYKNPQKA